MWPFRRKTHLASRLALTPPDPAPDRDGFAIVVIARNEAASVRDWMTVHALAGVDHVVLYDNGSQDDTVARAQAHGGIPVTVVPWHLDTTIPGRNIRLHQQTLAYAHAIQTFGGRFRWMAFIDMDEMLIPRSPQTLGQIMAPLAQHGCVSLPWVMFGHNGHATPPGHSDPFDFTARARDQSGPLLKFKCIVDPCDVIQVGVHTFATRTLGHQSANMNGVVTGFKQRASPAFVTNNRLQLNHYYLKSRAEMEAKITGKAISGTAQMQRRAAVERKAALIEADSVTDTAALEFLKGQGIETAQDLKQRFAGDA